MADASQSESVIDRFAAYGFNCIRIEDGHDMQAIAMLFPKPEIKLETNFIHIAKGIPEVAGTAGGHGEGGAKFAESARKGLGLPDETFYVSDEVHSFFEQHKADQAQNRQQWNAIFSAWQAATPEKAALLASGLNREVPADLMDHVQVFAEDAGRHSSSWQSGYK